MTTVTAAERYQELMGHPPPRDDTEEAWQWDYQGRSEADKERLLDLIQDEAEAEQESLF